MKAATPKSHATVAWTILAACTTLLVLADLYAIFLFAPVEVQMGVAQKIFYFHVPSAYAMYVGFVTSAVGSAMYLVRRSAVWDAVAVAGAEVGVLFAMTVLITGPLWARKAWGVWWTWDPRLTTMLLAAMIFVAFLALRSFGAAGEAEKRFASGLALLGALNIPIIHYSVKRWRGQHPTVITDKGGGLDGDMWLTFGLSLVTFTFLVSLLLWARIRAERLRQSVLELELSAAERGLMEDDA